MWLADEVVRCRSRGLASAASVVSFSSHVVHKEEFFRKRPRASDNGVPRFWLITPKEVLS